MNLGDESFWRACSAACLALAVEAALNTSLLKESYIDRIAPKVQCQFPLVGQWSRTRVSQETGCVLGTSSLNGTLIQIQSTEDNTGELRIFILYLGTEDP